MQDTIFKLEVGKTYRTRNGDNHITIVSETNFHHEANDNSKVFPFLGNDGCPYTAEGRFFRDFDSAHDLVEEVSSKLQLEVGKSYLSRNGSTTVKIIGITDEADEDYEESRPYIGDDEEFYGTTGNFNFDPSVESEFDLVKEAE